MTDHTKSDPLEQELKHYKVQEPAAGLEARLEEGLDSTTSSRASIFVFIAMAAACLLAVGVWKWMPNSASLVNAEFTDTSIISKGEMLVLHLDKKNKSLAVQSYDQFQMQSRSVGDVLGQGRLLDVNETTFRIQDDSGQERDLNATQYNEVSSMVLRNEVKQLDVLLSGKQLQPANVQRLIEIARFGEPLAVTLLERIAMSASDVSMQAKAALGDDREISAMRRLIDTAENGSGRFQQQAIRLLSGSNSPLAADCLQGILLGRDVEAARYILSTWDTSGLMSPALLRTCIETAMTAEIRRVAEIHLSELLQKETSNESQ